MRVRRILAITLAMILVLGTINLGYGTENTANTDTQTKLDGPKSVDNTGTPAAINYQGDEGELEDSPPAEEPKEEPEDPDNLGRPVEIKSPKLEKPKDEPKLRTFSIDQDSMSVMAVVPNGEYGNISSPNPGYIELDKTATKVDDECNLWDIELTLTGIDGEQTSDTVLVIDRSGSMDDVSKFNDAKDAAKAFVNLVLDGTNDFNHRIAVVSFGGTNVTNEIGFSSDKTSIISAIDNIANPSGGTHTQAGLKQAGMVIDSSSADSQNVVLLSDGEATYSYGINNPDTYATEIFDPTDYGFGDNSDIDYRTTSLVPYTAFNYSITVGDGTSGHTRYDNGISEDYYYRHGASAVAEASYIKADGTKVYTVSLDNNSEGEWTLDNIASPGSNYSTSGGDLNDIYQEIAGSIVYAASDAVIIDPLGSMFNIPGINGSNYNTLITVSRGTLAWDNNTETITWTLGKISSSDPATMTYKVEMDQSGFGMGMLPTNGDTFVNYTNINEQDAMKNFEVPEVRATCEPEERGELTIIKRVFVDGEEVLEDDTEFEFTVDGQTVTASVNEDGNINLLTGDYTVEEINFGDWVPDDLSQDVTVTPNGARVTFINRYTTPDGDVKIIKNIGVENTAVHERVKFQLKTLDGTLVAEGYTDSNGELVFDALDPGEYNLVEVVPDDFETSFTGRITVVGGETTTVKVLNNMIENEGSGFEDEGNTIKGYKFNSYEEGLPGWTIELYEEGGEVPIATTVTDEDGYYEFTGLEEGTYTVKEVMKDGWYNLTPISQTVVITGMNGPTFVKHLEGDSDLIEALPESEIEFVTEGRIGDLGGNATHELNIHTPPYVIEDDYWNLNWSNNGVPMPFEIIFDGTTLTYETGGQILTYVPESVDEIYDIMIRTRATKPNSGVMINNLKLNGTPVPYTSVAVGNSDGIDVLWMHNYNLTAGFTLEGESVMYWTEKDKPKNSHLAYQIKFGNAKDQGVTWASSFMNEEYGDVTVFKEIDGEQVEMDFNFRIYEGDGIEGDIVAQTSVDINNPELIENLPAGTYTIAEQPVEGYITPQPYTFDLEAGESLEITLTNIERVPEPEPSMIIEKVADDYSVYVGDDVTYTITVTNTGDMDLDYVYVTDDELGYSENVNIPAGGSFSHSITTSYDSTGTKENTARAEYGIETNDYFMVEDTVEVEVNRRSTPSGTYRMTIEKEAMLDEVEIGDLVEFTITVENTGNRTLTNIEVVDDMTGLDETITLSPGESETFNVSVVAEEEGLLTNTAEATHDRASLVQDSDSVNVVEDEEDIPDEDIPEGVPGTFEITINKTAVVDGESIFFGDMVEFIIVVTNTGDETIDNILVEDQMVDFEAVIDELSPGESEEFTVMVAAPNVPGPFTNTATATSTETGTVNADDTVFIEEEIPLDVPDTGVAPTDLFFGLGALVSGLGIYITKKRK